MLCRYVAYLGKKISYNSVKQYLNVVRLLHLEAGLQNPIADNYQLNTVLAGLKRDLGSSVNRKLPITPDILLRIKPFINTSLARDNVFWAVTLTMFFGLLRKSNALPPSSNTFTPAKHLTRSDLSVLGSGIAVTIRHSKTIQHKDRHHTVFLPTMPDHPLCPVTAVLAALRHTLGAPQDSPAFTLPSAGGPTTYTQPMFAKQLDSYLTLAKIDTRSYGTHSLRRGGASVALQAGIPVEYIRIMGDWQTDCFRAYLTPSMDSLVQAMGFFSASLPVDNNC